MVASGEVHEDVEGPETRSGPIRDLEERGCLRSGKARQREWHKDQVIADDHQAQQVPQRASCASGVQHATAAPRCLIDQPATALRLLCAEEAPVQRPMSAGRGHEARLRVLAIYTPPLRPFRRERAIRGAPEQGGGRRQRAQSHRAALSPTEPSILGLRREHRGAVAARDHRPGAVVPLGALGPALVESDLVRGSRGAYLSQQPAGLVAILVAGALSHTPLQVWANLVSCGRVADEDLDA
mmetsp:Transcript_3223/g.9343  ORF Transcript_3223/g.9343 Transcript_3223/m.9343 type:complete len:240 (+) Transcript_3223:1433-2152(+)